MVLPVPPELIDRFLDRRLVIVAGPSFAAAAGMAARAALPQAIIEDLRRGHLFDEDRPPIERAEKAIGRGDVCDALTQLKASQPAAYRTGVRRHLDDTEREVPSLHSQVAALAPMLQAVISCNLDRLFDRAFHGHWPALVRATPGLGQRRHYLFKLHGELDHPETWVLTRNEYESASNAQPERRYLDAMFRSSTLLLVGFEWDDRELQALLEVLYSGSHDLGPEHFAWLPASGIGPVERSHLAERGIRAVLFSDGQEAAALTAILTVLATAQARSSGAGPTRRVVQQILQAVAGSGAAAPRLPWEGELLMFSANGTTQESLLTIDEEFRATRDALRNTGLHVEISPAATFPAVIRDILDQAPIGVHFSGHGQGAGELILRDEADGIDYAEAPQIAAMFALVRTSPRLVTFCTCFSEDVAKATSVHVPYAIGFVDRLPDHRTHLFSRTLYERLTAGDPVEVAFGAAALASGLTSARLFQRPGVLVAPADALLDAPSSP